MMLMRTTFTQCALVTSIDCKFLLKVFQQMLSGLAYVCFEGGQHVFVPEKIQPQFDETSKQKKSGQEESAFMFSLLYM